MPWIACFDCEIEATTREIDACAGDDAYVDVLCQMRGIGRYIAMLISPRSARSPASQAPATPALGRPHPDRAKLGRQGQPRSHLRPGIVGARWALVEAAQHAATGGGPLRAGYERIAKRGGKRIAKMAVARQDPHCYYGLRDGEIRCLAPRAKARTIGPTAAHRDPPQPARRRPVRR